VKNISLLVSGSKDGNEKRMSFAKRQELKSVVCYRATEARRSVSSAQYELSPSLIKSARGKDHNVNRIPPIVRWLAFHV
jgi:hypothetical protein